MVRDGRIEATQQESPSRQLLFDDSEDRFDQRLSPFVRISSFVGRHPDTMTAQCSVVRPYRHTAAKLFGLRTDSEGRARLTDASRGPVQTPRDSIQALDTKKLEPQSLWTPEAVAVLVIGKSVLVIWVPKQLLSRLRHRNRLASTSASFQALPGMESGICQRHL